MSASIEQKTTPAASTTGTSPAPQNIIVLEKVKNNGVNQVVQGGSTNNNNNNNTSSGSKNILNNNQKVRVISNLTVVSKAANLGTVNYVELNNKNYLNGNYSTLLTKSTTPISTSSTTTTTSVVGGVITSNGKIINVKAQNSTITPQCVQGMSTTPITQKISIPKKFQVVTTTKLNSGSHNVSPSISGGLTTGNIFMCRASDVAADCNQESSTTSINATPSLQIKNNKIKTIKITAPAGNSQQNQQSFSHLKVIETLPKDINKNATLTASGSNYIIQTPSSGTLTGTSSSRVINSKGAKMICTGKSKYLTIKNSNIQLNANDLQQVSHADLKKKNSQSLGLLTTNAVTTSNVTSTTNTITQKIINKPLAKVTLNYKASNLNNNNSVINKNSNSNLNSNKVVVNNNTTSSDDINTMPVINAKNTTYKIINSPTKAASVNQSGECQQQQQESSNSMEPITTQKVNNLINGTKMNNVTSSLIPVIPLSPTEASTMCSEEIMSARILQTLSTNSRMIDNSTRINSSIINTGNTSTPVTHNSTTQKIQKYKKGSVENSSKVSNEADSSGKMSSQPQYQINQQYKQDNQQSQQQQNLNNKYSTANRTKQSIASPSFMTNDINKNDVLYAVLQDHTYFAIMPSLRQSSTSSTTVATNSAQSSSCATSSTDEQQQKQSNSSANNMRSDYTKMGNSLLSPNLVSSSALTTTKNDYSKIQSATSTMNRTDYSRRADDDDDANSVISSGCNSPSHNNDNDLGEETETAAEGEDDSITRCICDLVHDDGYMICCDKCSAWQHVDCMGIDRSNIPDEYLCEICQPRQIDKARARSLQLHKRRQQSSDLMFTTTPSNSNLMPGLNNLAAAAAAVAAAQGDAKDFHSNSLKNSDGNNMQYNTHNQQSVIVSNVTNTKNSKKRRNKNSDLMSPNDKRPRTSKKETTCILNKKRELTKKYTKKSSKIKKNDFVGTPTSSINASNNEKVSTSIRNWIENYETAITNHYSPELRARLQALGKLQQQHSQQQYTAMKSFQIQNLIERCATVPHSGAKILISTDEIPPDTPIIEIRGKYMLYNQLPYPGGCNNNNTIGLNGSIYNLNKNVGPFLFFYKLPNNGPEICVDTRTYGNDARFVRRSCRPNAGIIHRLEKGVIHLYIVATTTIKSSTEISIKHEINEITQQYLPIISHTTGSNCACGLTKDCNYPHVNIMSPVFDKSNSRKLSSSSSSSTKQFKRANGNINEKQLRKRKQKKSESKTSAIKSSPTSPNILQFAVQPKNNIFGSTSIPSPSLTPPICNQQQQQSPSNTSPINFTTLAIMENPSLISDNQDLISVETKSSLLPTPSEMENKLIISTCVPLSPKINIKIEKEEAIKIEPLPESSLIEVKDILEEKIKEEVEIVEKQEPIEIVKSEVIENINIAQNSSEVNMISTPPISESPKESPTKPVSIVKTSANNKTNRKMTREERKMEAIVKAFEKMEQYQQRKQEMKQQKKRTISSQSYDNDGYGSETGTVNVPSNNTSTSSPSCTNTNKKPLNHQFQQQKRKKRRAKQSPGMILVKKNKKVKSQNKLNSSSGGESSSDHLTSEESMTMMSPLNSFNSQQPSQSILKSPINHQSQHNSNTDMYDYSTTSNNAASLLLALSQPVNNSGMLLDNMQQDKTVSTTSSNNLPLVSSACMLIEAAVGPFESSSSSNSNSVTPEMHDNNDFKYPHKTKTKKTIMNDWLNQSDVYSSQTLMRPTSIRMNEQDSGYISEGKCTNFEIKNDISIVTKTLEDFIQQNDEKKYCVDMFGVNIENTGSIFGQKFNLQQDIPQNIASPDNLISPTSILQSSIGGESAAKKRWLRQAISEECTDEAMLLTPTSLPSPTNNFTTPLKKRRVIREECNVKEEDIKEKDDIEELTLYSGEHQQSTDCLSDVPTNTLDDGGEEDESVKDVQVQHIEKPVEIDIEASDNAMDIKEENVLEEEPALKIDKSEIVEEIKNESDSTNSCDVHEEQKAEIKVAEPVVFHTKASYKQSAITSRRSSLPIPSNSSTKLLSSKASKRELRRSRSPHTIRRSRSPICLSDTTKLPAKRSTLLSPVRKPRSPTPPSVLNEELANFEKVIASFHTENIMILQSRNKKMKKESLNGDLQKQTIPTAVQVQPPSTQSVKPEIQLNFDLSTLQQPFWREPRTISAPIELNLNTVLPSTAATTKEGCTIYERYNYTKEIENIVKDDGYNITTLSNNNNQSNHINPVSSSTFPVQNNINKYPDYRSSLLDCHPTNNLGASSTIIINNNNNSANTNNLTSVASLDYVENNKLLYHHPHLNHNSTTKYDSILNILPSPSTTTKLIYDNLPKLTPTQSLLISSSDNSLLPTSKLLATPSSAVGTNGILSLSAVTVPGLPAATNVVPGAHDIYGVSKYFTKTASSDPRLNPNINAPEPVVTAVTPKRKLSITEYRKRKQQSNETTPDVRRSISSETFDEGNASGSTNNQQSQNEQQIQTSIEKSAEKEISAISIDLDIDSKIAQETSQLINDDAGTIAVLKLK